MLLFSIQACAQTINNPATVFIWTSDLWINLCICTYIKGWKVGVLWEYLSLKAINWRLGGDVFTCKLCSVVVECNQEMPWTYISSPLLPCWPEPCLGVYRLDVNSRGMWRPFHAVLFYLHSASVSFRRTGFGTSLPGQEKLRQHVGVISLSV